MADSKSVDAINKLLAAGEIWLPGGGLPATEDRCKESFANLIRFYNQALSQLTAGKRSDLEQYDLSTQPKAFARKSALPRILDKYLWMEGKKMSERGAGRA